MRMTRTNLLTSQAIVVVASLALTVLAARYISAVGITYREVIVVGVALCSLLVVLLGDLGLRFGLGVFVALFALGHRTLPVVGRYSVHPLLLLALGLAVLVLLARRLTLREPTEPPPPIVVSVVAYAMMAFWLWGALVALANGAAPDLVLIHTANLFMVLPVFVMVTGIVANDHQRDLYWVIMLGASTFIALVASFEYLFPGLAARVAPGFFTRVGGQADVSGFMRATFSAFGHQQGIFVAVLAAPFLLPLWGRFPQVWARALLLGALLVMLYGIYIAGWRSVWLQTGLLVVLTAALKSRRGVGLVAVLLLGLVAYQLLPSAFQDRLGSVSGLFTGRIETLDNSARQRFVRAEFSLSQILNAPWGVGASRSGWPHNDFLLLAAETGVLGGLLFAGWYGTRTLALWRLYARTRRDDDLALALSMTSVGMLMLGHPLTVRDYTMMPVWFVWALAERRLWQARQVTSETADDQQRLAAPGPARV